MRIVIKLHTSADGDNDKKERNKTTSEMNISIKGKKVIKHVKQNKSIRISLFYYFLNISNSIQF